METRQNFSLQKHPQITPTFKLTPNPQIIPSFKLTPNPQITCQDHPKPSILLLPDDDNLVAREDKLGDDGREPEQKLKIMVMSQGIRLYHRVLAKF